MRRHQEISAYENNISLYRVFLVNNVWMWTVDGAACGPVERCFARIVTPVDQLYSESFRAQ
jgi:hypothetical protein